LVVCAIKPIFGSQYLISYNMKFNFYSVKGEKVFESEDLSQVEIEAKKYKQSNNLKKLQICKEKGEFVKWI
jgi:hypothetical protein